MGKLIAGVSCSEAFSCFWVNWWKIDEDLLGKRCEWFGGRWKEKQGEVGSLRNSTKLNANRSNEVLTSSVSIF
jgi:hypothetical protein